MSTTNPKNPNFEQPAKSVETGGKTEGVQLTVETVREMIDTAKDEVLNVARKESKDEMDKQVIMFMSVFGLFAMIFT
jgi:hypothetical protein